MPQGLSNIRNLSLKELQEAFVSRNEKSFRAKQVYEWLWKKNAASFDEMTNLSKDLRELLQTHFYIDHIQLQDQQISKDKTIKCAFTIEEGKVVEGVLIPTTSRMTACISSQVGCSLSCTFCATGRLKLLRNLSAGEIVDQVVYLKNQAEERYGQNLTNIVYMGMGEHDRIDLVRGHRQGRPVAQPQLLVALEQTAIDQQAVAVVLYQVLGAGHCVGSAQKSDVDTHAAMLVHSSL